MYILVTKIENLPVIKNIPNRISKYYVIRLPLQKLSYYYYVKYYKINKLRKQELNIK